MKSSIIISAAVVAAILTPAASRARAGNSNAEDKLRDDGHANIHL
jgi:hypothetical protein